MIKLADWSSDGHYDDFGDDLIENWSPNNIKTIVIGGKYAAIEYFVPINNERVKMWEIQDILVDYKDFQHNRPVKCILRALNQFKIYSNLEEIVFTTDGYNHDLYSIDTNLNELCMSANSRPTDVFHRLYAVTKTDITFHQIWSYMVQTDDKTHVHYADILLDNKTDEDKVNIKYFNKDGWADSIVLDEKRYAMDVQGSSLVKYLKDVMYSVTGNVDYEDIVSKEESFKALFTTRPMSEFSMVNFKKVKRSQEHMSFDYNNLFVGNMDFTKVKYFLANELFDEICDEFEDLGAIESVTITSGNQLVLNNLQIAPIMEYNLLLALPDRLFTILTGKTKETFNNKAIKHFKRIPNLDSDLEQFEEWVHGETLNWGYIFDFKYIYKFPNLKKLSINNPYRIESAKIEVNLVKTPWNELYTRIPTLKENGIYLDGYYISKETEMEFLSVEKALNMTSQIILDYNRANHFYLTQVMDLLDTESLANKIFGKEVGSVVHNKFSNVKAIASTLGRLLES